MSRQRALKRYLQCAFAAPMLVGAGAGLALCHLVLQTDSLRSGGSAESLFDRSSLMAITLYVLAIALMFGGASLGLIGAIRLSEHLSFTRRHSWPAFRATLWGVSIVEFVVLLAISFVVLSHV